MCGNCSMVAIKNHCAHTIKHTIEKHWEIAVIVTMFLYTMLHIMFKENVPVQSFVCEIADEPSETLYLCTSYMW